MEKHRYDVIVVGAGPSGSVLAADLAQAGLDVLLMDKSRFPRYKTCGGGVTKRALLKMPIDISSVIRNKIDTFVTIGASNDTKTFNSKHHCVFTVMRNDLDDLLVRHAMDCGAEFKEDARVQRVVEHSDYVSVFTRDDEFTGAYVVGADGVNSLVARQAGLMAHRQKALAIEHELLCTPAVQSLYQDRIVVDYGKAPFGYVWIFPKRDHLSVGIGSYALSSDEMIPILDDFVLEHRLQGELLSAKGHYLSVGGIPGSITTSRIALIGDAAALVESFAGEGIYYALWSAELLAGRLKKAFSGDGMALAKYQKDVDTQVMPELQALYKMGNFCYKHPRVVENILSTCPWLMKGFFDSLEGKHSYDQLFRRLTKLLPA